MEQTFRVCQLQWVTNFITEGSAEDLKEYIDTEVKKEKDDTMHHLVTRAKTLQKRHYCWQEVPWWRPCINVHFSSFYETCEDTVFN